MYSVRSIRFVDSEIFLYPQSLTFKLFPAVVAIYKLLLTKKMLLRTILDFWLVKQIELFLKDHSMSSQAVSLQMVKFIKNIYFKAFFLQGHILIFVLPPSWISDPKMKYLFCGSYQLITRFSFSSIMFLISEEKKKLSFVFQYSPMFMTCGGGHLGFWLAKKLHALPFNLLTFREENVNLRHCRRRQRQNMDTKQ